MASCAWMDGLGWGESSACESSSRHGNRSKQKMDIDRNKWKSIETNGNRFEHVEIGPNKEIGNIQSYTIETKMEIGPNKLKSIRTNGNRSEQMEIGPNKWKSIRTNGNRSKQMEIRPNKKASNGN